MKGKMASVQQVSYDCDYEGVPDGDTDLVLYLIEDEEEILCHYQDATNHYYCTQSTFPTPIRLCLPTLLKTHPSKVLALPQQKYAFHFNCKEQISGKDQKLNEPKLSQSGLTSLIEDEKKKRSYYFGEDTTVINVHIQFSIFFCEIVEKEDDCQQEVHENDEGMHVVVIYYDPNQQCSNIPKTQIDCDAHTTRSCKQLQGIFELQVLMGKFQLLEEKEDDAVDKDAQLILHARVDYGPEKIHIVCHQRPLYYQHVVDVFRTQRSTVCHYHQALPFTLHTHHPMMQYKYFLAGGAGQELGVRFGKMGNRGQDKQNFIILNLIIDSQMFNKEVSTPGEFPVEESKRWSTDVCCTFVGAIFAITLFVLACVFFNSNTLNSTYFQTTDLVAKADYDGFKAALLWAGLFALAIGVLTLTLIQLAPKQAPLAFILVAMATLIVLGIIWIVRTPDFLANIGVKIFALIVVFGLALIVIFMAVLYRNALRLQGIFLDYARRFLAEKVSTFAYIPIFLALTAGLFALFLFQHAGFSSKVHSSNNFFDFSSAGFLGWLNLIEFIWGLQFLRDAFTFCVSGVAVDWYWGKDSHWYTPARRLITKNWGSVVAGSFLNAFLEIPTLLVELLTCHKKTVCNRAGEGCENNCFCLDYVFNLVRTDVYSYINLSGIPYCNSARECAKLCHFNEEFVGNYNPVKHVRFVILVFVVAISTLFGYLFTNIRVDNFSFWHLFFLIVVVYAVSVWFVGIATDSAEAIATSFFVEHFQAHDYEFMQKALPSFRKELEHGSKLTHHDGLF